MRTTNISTSYILPWESTMHKALPTTVVRPHAPRNTAPTSIRTRGTSIRVARPGSHASGAIHSHAVSYSATPTTPPKPQSTTTKAPHLTFILKVNSMPRLLTTLPSSRIFLLNTLLLFLVLLLLLDDKLNLSVIFHSTNQIGTVHLHPHTPRPPSCGTNDVLLALPPHARARAGITRLSSLLRLPPRAPFPYLHPSI